MYLEIPYRYKYTKKFKIDDWFPVKPYEKATISSEPKSIMARVVLKYEANVRLKQNTIKNIEGVEPLNLESPKKEFNAQMKDLTRDLQLHEKEGFAHLEDVEKKIRARRRREDRSTTASTKRRLNQDPSSALGWTLTQKKNFDLGARAHSNIQTKQFALSDAVTPDNLYKTANRGKNPVHSVAENDKLLMKLKKESGSLREEISGLRAKTKALEEGQMTVDNLKLSRQLDAEKETLNKERAQMLKQFSIKNENLEQEKKKLAGDLEERENKLALRGQQQDEQKRKLEEEQALIKIQIAENSKRMEELDKKLATVTQEAQELSAERENIDNEKESLQEYGVELENMKQGILKEREHLITEKAKLLGEKDEIQSEISELKRQKQTLVDDKEKEFKELQKRKNELDLREDELERNKRQFSDREEEVTKKLNEVDKIKKESSKLKEEIEEHHVALWKDRNQLNNDVKEFMEDKKTMENDLQWQRKEMEEQIKVIEKEKEGLDEERYEIEDFKQQIENLKMDLEFRERKLLQEQEDFYQAKKRYIDKLLENGKLEDMTDETKQMAKDMGIDVDDLIEESKRLNERKELMDKLKKENDEQLDKINALKEQNTSRANSRRQSLTNLNQMISDSQKHQKTAAEKLATKSYLADVYEDSSTAFMVKDLEEKRKALEHIRGELDFSKELNQKMGEENKELKKQLDIVSKLVKERPGGENIDLDSLLGRTASLEKEVQTEFFGELENFNSLGCPSEMNEGALRDRIRQLEMALQEKNKDLGQSSEDGSYWAQKRGSSEDMLSSQLDSHLQEYALLTLDSSKR